MCARILSCTRCNFGCEKIHDQAVFVGSPDRAVQTQKRCTGALFTAKASRTVKESRHKPFEADRNFVQSASKLLHHAIDESAAHQSFAHDRLFGPMRTVP